MPLRSKLKNVPVRPQPAWMSSTMSRAPTSRAMRATARIQAFEALARPPSPCTVSSRIAAGASMPEAGSASMSASSCAVSTEPR